MKTKLAVCILAVLAVLVLASTPAYAQATRTWVSGVGDDANPCSRTAPCKTFAGSISKTAVGGEINVLDPGGFGAVTITKAITISSQGFEAGVLVSGTNGIVVAVPNATDTVILRGLDIEGLGTGLSGVLVNTGGDVTVENSTINNFTTNGITFTPTVAGSQLHVSNTIVRNCGTLPNSGQGINIAPSSTASAVLDRVRLDHNIAGLKINTAGGSASVTESVAANNVFAGFSAGVSGAVLNLELSTSTHNATGVSCAAGSTVRLGNMSITDNTAATGGTCSSFKNNDIDQVVTLNTINPQ
ncbi:MAG TPA: hypothetical protein VN970_10090 [Thermoanaerobaculia bacterium]|nr:hypothetical protein [Thermoanaerobaculia bacterium]